jgi:predicted alpha-1,6-mannanase (GH76 family)
VNGEQGGIWKEIVLSYLNLLSQHASEESGTKLLKCLNNRLELDSTQVSHDYRLPPN